MESDQNLEASAYRRKRRAVNVTMHVGRLGEHDEMAARRAGGVAGYLQHPRNGALTSQNSDTAAPKRTATLSTRT